MFICSIYENQLLICLRGLSWKFYCGSSSSNVGAEDCLATRNAVVSKASEVTPLTVAIYPLVFDLAGSWLSRRRRQHCYRTLIFEKVAFTGNTDRKVMEAAAKSNLKNVTLELGGKTHHRLWWWFGRGRQVGNSLSFVMSIASLLFSES